MLGSPRQRDDIVLVSLLRAGRQSSRCGEYFFRQIVFASRTSASDKDLQAPPF